MNGDDEKEILTAESGTLAVLHASEIDTQIATAQKYKRSIKRARDELLQLVTLTEQVASECVYALPRKKDGKKIIIEGASVRFAEILAHSWGNCRAGTRMIDDKGDYVVAQGVFHDLEKNVSITSEVQRRITDKEGRRYSADMIGVTSNAACSIALRNSILKGVPKALWIDAYNAARQVIMGDAKTLVSRRATAMATMQKFGLDAAQVCTILGRAGLDDIGLEDLVTLHGICSALREGDTTVERLLEEATGELPVKTSSASEKVRQTKKPKESPQEPREPAAVASAGAEPELPLGDASEPAADTSDNLFADRLIMVSEAETLGQLDYIAAMVKGRFSENQEKALAAALKNKRATLPATAE